MSKREGPPAMLDVLVVEDHADLAEEVVAYLRARGFTVRAADCGRAMDEAIAERRPDVILLDLGLPEEDGVSIARRLAANERPGDPGIAVVVMTARGRVEDRILGLNAGADIYLVKPLDMRELEAAIAAVMRRRGGQPSTEARPWRLEAARWRLLTPGGTAISLSEVEVKLLTPFFDAPEAVIERRVLAAHLAVDDRGIDLLLHRLRRKVESEAGEVLPLRTLRSRGYAFAAPVAS
ncbi:response regulator transcription factor [Azospirillum sp. YIM B02556]|uniref:Response regulator transcription factor n=1 Tax=Azospirillum endophyticum TaxID=2800326 RepID=A0ABS1EYJ8_9PROT|nr:response regulator transcription factor [Azospirillum endophyticum]MBK1836232.1 response regulator transcription factor [Azospirillum endophyticum]